MDFFIPGTHPHISLEELKALDPAASFNAIEKGVFLGEMSLSLSETAGKTGGIIKAGTIITELDNYDKEELAAILASLFDTEQEQARFGISLYYAGGEKEMFKTLKEDRDRLGLTVKTFLKDQGKRVRYVTSKQANLSAVVVTKNKLIEEGREFVLIAFNGKLLIAETSFVQDFEAWGKRDYGRPAHDAKSGMLPPKLAHMMVNLSKQNAATSYLWDPFCGSGTILMEAAMLGYQKLLGSDISEKAVRDTVKNIGWLERTEDIKMDTTILAHDAMEPLPEEVASVFNAIVSEGYLGPPLRRDITVDELSKIKTELEALYKKSFANISKYLEKDGVIVFALPVFRVAGNDHFLHVDLGELTIDPYKSDLGKISPRGGLVYARENQRVGREVIKLRK